MNCSSSRYTIIQKICSFFACLKKTCATCLLIIKIKNVLYALSCEQRYVVDHC